MVRQLRQADPLINVRLLSVRAFLGDNVVMLLLQFGNMRKDLAQYNTGLFAEKVLPQLKDVFAEWDDRWWPKPMERAERAALPSFQPPAVAAE